MIERKKGENDDKVKSKALGQLVAVKERNQVGWRQGGQDNRNMHKRGEGREKGGGKDKRGWR